MKDKHLDIRIRQCLVLAESSGCPRRKFGAVLIDPERNVVLADGYNGGPRGATGGPLCRGSWCERDGLTLDQVHLHFERASAHWRTNSKWVVTTENHCADDSSKILWEKDNAPGAEQEGNQFRAQLVAAHPPVQSGTRMELGCHHAESNVVANAAANGVSTRGAWLIVTGEPCAMCARLLHHAGVVCVVVVKGGYAGGDAGVQYLQRAGVRIIYRDGPQDPRSEFKIAD